MGGKRSREGDQGKLCERRQDIVGGNTKPELLYSKDVYSAVVPQSNRDGNLPSIASSRVGTLRRRNEPRPIQAARNIALLSVRFTSHI